MSQDCVAFDLSSLGSIRYLVWDFFSDVVAARAAAKRRALIAACLTQRLKVIEQGNYLATRPVGFGSSGSWVCQVLLKPLHQASFQAFCFPSEGENACGSTGLVRGRPPTLRRQRSRETDAGNAEADCQRDSHRPPQVFFNSVRTASKAISWHRRTQGCTQAPHSCNRHLPVSECDSGEVFNVWRGWNFYGHGAPYNSFAGRDATRFLAKQIVSEEEDDGQPLTREAGLPKSLLTSVVLQKLHLVVLRSSHKNALPRLVASP